MQTFNFTSKSKRIIMALGAESAGNFSVFHDGKIYFSENFSDLLDDNNFQKFQTAVLEFLKKNKIRPNIILTDLHPLYKTTLWGAELAKRYEAKHVHIQHHLAHIFSSVGEKIIHDSLYKIPNSFYGIALDGTGYGLDGKIWGGEAFAISNFQIPISKQITNLKKQNLKFKIQRIGHLENQFMIGGDLAVREPARMLISILSKFLNKEKVYNYAKKYYSKNKFEVLYNQLQQNFNCIEASSIGRVLDAVSVLLGSCSNKRNYKHEPIDLLEKNSTKPYGIKPVMVYEKKDKQYILQTTPLFEYLVKNLHKDKHRLAATAQLYIAQGLYAIIKKNTQDTKYKIPDTFIAGGIANNKIISSYLESKDAYANKKVPVGDAGLSFGQIIYHLTITDVTA